MESAFENLCSVCRDFDLYALLAATQKLLGPTSAAGYWPGVPPSFKYHFGFGGILEGWKSGCKLCMLIWSQFGQKTSCSIQGIERDPSRGGQFYLIPKIDENGVLLATNEAPEKQPAIKNPAEGLVGAHRAYADRLRAIIDEVECRWTVELRLFADQGAVPPDLALFFRNNRPQDGTTSLRTGAQWLTQCKEGHPKCGKPEAREMPTRVIDVHSEPPRLLFTNRAKAHWAALSYCWGKTKQVLLTLENLDQFHQCLPVEEIPKTAQDAIRIAKALGVRYLWIDALCIIQNSPDDWHEEAAKMKTVYRDALLILCAASAPDAGCGMMTRGDDEDDDATTCKLELWSADPSNDCTVLLRPNNTPRGSLSSPLTNCSVVKRGWCLQENLLSRRTLYFTDQGLLWECATITHSEDGRSEPLPEASPKDTTALYRGSLLVRHDTTERIRVEGLTITTTKAAWLNTDDPWELWSVLLKEYTSRSLTVETDILNALAGLAEELSPMMRCRYFAGLWEKNFVQQMLWQRHYDNDLRDSSEGAYLKPSAYRAPSWSWAAINGEPVKFHPISRLEHNIHNSRSTNGSVYHSCSCTVSVKTHFAKVIDVDTTLAGKGEYGRVEDGYAVLKGQFRIMPSPLEAEHLNEMGNLGSYLISSRYHETGEFEQQHKPQDGQVFGLFELCRWDVKYPWNPLRKRPTAADKALFHNLQDHGVYLLVLESVGKTASAFRRVGLCKVEYSDADDTKGDPELVGQWKNAYKEIGGKGWSERLIKLV